MFKININFKEFRDVVKNYEKETRTSTFARKVSKHLTKLSRELKKEIQDNFIKNNDMPKSYSFKLKKNVRPHIKFVLPQRLKFPRSRTGRLKSSISVIRGERTNIEGFKNYKRLYVSLYVGLNLKKAKYGRILEYGGIIRPKKRKYLSIPVDKESFGKSPKEFNNLKLYRKFLIKRTGKFTYKPLYLLLKRVNIKPFNYIKKSYLKFKKSNKYKSIVTDLSVDLSNWLKNTMRRK